MRDRTMKRGTNGRSLLGLDDDVNDGDIHKQHTSQSEQLLMEHNDDKVNQLGAKVGVIKQIAVDIESQTRESNRLLDGLDESMTGVQGLLAKTMGSLNQLVKEGGSRHMLYLILFMLFVFFVIYFLVKRS
eukprot:TRINITY_DN1091_c0_g1_i1.p1 TRINITY_DN1091_c0_g1~~TRINITY_DN1091_c0_g1_i1.p1  ORF type:complete len:130 (+),score=29.47 TRINITY_DN1091_c0_g1_i1:92-481(+)